MNKERTTEYGSITLGMVFGLGILSLGIFAFTLTSVVTNVSAHGNTMSGLRTLVTADTNAREGVYQLLKNPTSFSGGSGVITNHIVGADSTITATPESASIVKISGSAKNARTQREVEYRVVLPVSTAVFDHAIYSENDIKYGGSASTTGDVYAAGDIDVIGNPTLDGDISAAGTIDGASTNHTGNSDPGVVPLVSPSIDTTEYKARAFPNTCYGCAGSGKSVADGESEYAGLSGDNIVYFAGSAHLTGGSITGTLLAEGDLTINTVQINPGTSANYDSSLVLYSGGDLSINGGSDIHGLVYTEGEASFGGGTSYIVGAFFSTNQSSPVVTLGNIEITHDPLLVNISDTVGINKDAQILGWNEI